MDFYNIDNLKRDLSQNNLYNFFDSTFKYFTGVVLYQYIVNSYQEMRIDLICNDIYGSTDYCDFILDLNNIDNPLNLLSGDILLYVSVDQITYFRVDESTAVTLRNTYLNANKVSQPDPNRLNYVQNNYSLPPTYLQIPRASVSIQSGQIVLGGNT